MNLLITGSSGFVGNHLVCNLCNTGRYNIRAITRNKKFVFEHLEKVTEVRVSDIMNLDSDVLQGVDVIVHLASLAHIPASHPYYNENYIFSNNVSTVKKIVDLARDSGVSKIIYLSTASVYGDSSSRPITETCNFGVTSKLVESRVKAEQFIIDNCKMLGIEFIIIRSPLVYAYNSPANIGKLVKFTERFSLSPFPFIKSKRSFIGVNNLSDFIEHCISSSDIDNGIYNISDMVDLTVHELLLVFNEGKKLNNLPIPRFLFSLLFCSLGKRDLGKKILDSFLLDCTKVSNNLAWSPPYSPIQDFLISKSRFNDKNS